MAAVLLDVLEREGVRHLFGLPGGALVAILNELKSRRDQLTYVVCRHETGAAYAADGYARAGGGLGVVLVTSGPGATNSLTGTMNADAAGTPLLAITGEIATQYFGRGYLQEGVDAGLDVVEVFRGAAGYSEIVGSALDFPELLFSALRVARGVPNRAAHLSIPGDIAATPVAGFIPPITTAAYRATPGSVDRAGVGAAVEVIAAAQRPLLLLGNGCRAALRDTELLAQLTAAVEVLAVPVITEPDSKGIFPETHELSLRNYGMAGCSWPRYYMCDLTGAGRRQFDTLVVIGCQLGELATYGWEPYDPILVPAGPFVQIDDDQREIGRTFSITRGVVSEIGPALRAFADAAIAHAVQPAVVAARRAFIASIKNAHSPFADPAAASCDSDPIKPQALIAVLNDVLPAGGHVWVDAGNCVGWCLNGLVIDPPTRAHFSLSMGPMGFAVGAVVGGKLADPAATGIAVVGDGGFMMHLGEVATAAQYRVGAIWVVLADHDLAMVSQGMTHVEDDPSFLHYYEIGWNDLATAAQGLGADAVMVRTVADTRAALVAAIARAAEGVPQVVGVVIDTSEIPSYYPPPYPPATSSGGRG
ncbi:MAG: thiamine pyrophosphate-binding protein [Pseudonocardiaceae bacterium]